MRDATIFILQHMSPTFYLLIVCPIFLDLELSIIFNVWLLLHGDILRYISLFSSLHILWMCSRIKINFLQEHRKSDTQYIYLFLIHYISHAKGLINTSDDILFLRPEKAQTNDVRIMSCMIIISWKKNEYCWHAAHAPDYPYDGIEEWFDIAIYMLIYIQVIRNAVHSFMGIFIAKSKFGWG